MSMWDAFSCPLSLDWALLSDTLLLFGSHMSDAGQNRIGKTFAILIKLRIWQLTSCCRGWRTTTVGTNYPQLKASTGAFFRFPTVGLHAIAVTAGRQRVCHCSILPGAWYQAGFLCFPLPSSKSGTNQRANKIEVTGKRVWNFEWFLLNTISLHCTVNETAKLQSLRRTMIGHGSEKQFSVP